MKELMRSNDMVLLSALEDALKQAGIHVVVMDTHMSVVEGSLGILPRRVMVSDDGEQEGRAVLSRFLDEGEKP